MALCRDLETVYVKILWEVEELTSIARALGEYRHWLKKVAAPPRIGAPRKNPELSNDQVRRLITLLEDCAQLCGNGSHRILEANQSILEYVRFHKGVSEDTQRRIAETRGLGYRVREDRYSKLSPRCQVIYDMSTTPVHFPARRKMGGRLFLAPGDPLEAVAPIILPPQFIEDPYVVVMHGSASDSGFGYLMGDRESIPISAEEHAAMLQCDPEFDPSKTIWLVSCDTGNESEAAELGLSPYAQQLANLTGAEIVAPSDSAWLFADGSVIVCPALYGTDPDTGQTNWNEQYPDMTRPGSWFTFVPMGTEQEGDA